MVENMGLGLGHITSDDGKAPPSKYDTRETR